MKNKKALIVALIIGALLVIGIFGTGVAVATVAKNSSEYPPIIQKLVERFNLDPVEVRKVFDEERDERQKAMQTRFEGLLDQAVKDGKITDEQKGAIIAKQTEMQKKMDELRTGDLTPEEQQAKMQTLQEELTAWAEKNDIDLQYLHMFGRGMGRGGRFGSPGSFGHFCPTGTAPCSATAPWR